jgi:PAS domain S-box-containing protein
MTAASSDTDGGALAVPLDKAGPPPTVAPAMPEALSHAIVQAADDAVFSLDRDLRFTSWNAGAERIFGFAEDEVIGRAAPQILGAAPGGEGVLDRALQGLRQKPAEVVVSRKLGGDAHVSLSVAPIHDDQGGVSGIAVIARDAATGRDFRQLQAVLLAEMKHRVKNILSTVQAIARLTLGADRSAAYDTFEGRILALARAQDLMVREPSDGIDCQALLRMVLEPYPRQALSLAGPRLRVSSRAAVTLSLGIHELATNSLKYGALSVATGRVMVRWSHGNGSGNSFRLCWTESGGPPVQPPTRKGFGSVLIEKIMATELQGEVDLRYEPTGVVCTLTAKAEAVLEAPDYGLTAGNGG